MGWALTAAGKAPEALVGSGGTQVRSTPWQQSQPAALWCKEQGQYGKGPLYSAHLDVVFGLGPCMRKKIIIIIIISVCSAQVWSTCPAYKNQASLPNFSCFPSFHTAQLYANSAQNYRLCNGSSFFLGRFGSSVFMWKKMLVTGNNVFRSHKK